MELLDQGCALLRAQARVVLGKPWDTAPLSDEETRTLATALTPLSEALNTTAATAPYLQDPATRAAYVVGMAPRTLAAVLHELPPLPVGARVLDLGAGTGAGALACVLSGAAHVALVDHAPDALASAKELLGHAGLSDVTPYNFRLDTWLNPLRRIQFDLVLMAFSLLEAAGDDVTRATALLVKAERFVSEGGHILVVDSAQKSRARLINALREPLMEAGFHLWAPCPHSAACPALERERDFCHAARPWGLPDDVAQVGERAGLHRHRLAYSFLLVGRNPRPSAPPPVRVIGDVRREKGRARVAVCAEGPVRELVALQRDRATFEALQELPRGAGLRVKVPVDAERTLRVVDPGELTEVP
ncbi:MAG: small ribosomal subunit Rsm22 family protein [Myxococcota bacterium]